MATRTAGDHDYMSIRLFESKLRGFSKGSSGVQMGSNYISSSVGRGPGNNLKTAGAAHRAMIAGLVARLNAAGLLFFKIVDEFRHDSFFNAKLLLAGMRNTGVDSREPGGVS